MPDDYYAEAAEDEIFSGPTHDLIPSSYSSYHHISLGQRRYSRRDSGESRRSSFSLAGDFDRHRSDSITSFQYFSAQELREAEGSSTVAGDDNEETIEEVEEYPNQHHQHQYDLYDGSSDEEPLIHQEDFEYHGSRQFQRYYISEEDMRIVCAGYKRSRFRLYAYYVFCWVTLGIGYLILRWFPRWRINFLAQESPLGNCDLMVIENQWGELEILDVVSEWYGFPLSTIFNTENPDICPNQSEDAPYVDKDPTVPILRHTNYRYIRFIYNPLTDMFMTNTDWAASTWTTVDSALEGLSTDLQSQREMVFGHNSLEIRQPSMRKLLVDEVLHPFYIFQVFSIILWAFDEYLYYATAIFIVSITSVAEALVATRRTFQRLAEIGTLVTEIRVQRSGFWTTISSTDLVPGDVYELSDPNLNILPCDSILLSGDCIVNESILTGESVPVSKSPAGDQQLELLVHKGPDEVAKNFLYSGTKIIRVRKPAASHQGDEFEVALAMVVRTGFSTTKGALLRSMMFPKPSGFKFYRDSFRYIGVMACIAILGFSVSAYSFIKANMPWKLIVVRALDIVTIVVPPALPATLTIGTNISLSRLRKLNIFCITPSRVNVGGRIDVVAFDKTGTLTEDGLDVLGVHYFANGKFSPLVDNTSEIPDGDLIETLATCHELRVVNNELIGDPLDIKMFEFCGWNFEEDERNGCRMSWKKDSQSPLSIAKQFDFVSHLRRASVVVSGHNSTKVLVKGAPEVMQEICKSVPANFEEVLHQYTHRGYRVIACASRTLDEIADYQREDLERDLDFQGFIVFENKLKPVSAVIIKELEAANLRTIMCTGDNLLTAISVGRECGIITKGNAVFAPHFCGDINMIKWECVDNPDLVLDSNTLKPPGSYPHPYTLAIPGNIFRFIIECGTREQLEEMLIRTSIYARMSPDEKHELVIKLQSIDYTTCFCGDGANDCGALKEADVGISLSEAEASVAAPFTSRTFDISCVPTVIREGRCALNTSFSCFKYMSMYSAIQFVTVSILYSYGSNIGDFQFLWIDLFLIVPLAIFMAWSGPSFTLDKKRPGAKLISRKVLVPLIGMIVIVTVFQFAVWKYGHMQEWYRAPKYGDNNNLRSTDNTSLFEISSFQYIFVAYILCEGAPFRQPVYRNTPFLLTVAVCMAMTIIFIYIDPHSAFGKLMDMSPTSSEFKLFVMAMAGLNFWALVAGKNFLWPILCDFVRIYARKLGYKKERKRYKQLYTKATV